MLAFFKIAAQLIVGLGLLNVWLVRFNKITAYRGGNAKSMKEEFAVYGLPSSLVVGVGGLKILSALLLILGIWVPSVVMPAAAVVSGLMLGALAMHFKVRDPLSKSVPAFTVLALCLFLCTVSA